MRALIFALAMALALPAAAQAVDREAVTSYDQMRGGAPYNGIFNSAWQSFVAKSDTITHIGVTVGNAALPTGASPAQRVTVRLCDARPDSAGNCSRTLAQTNAQILNYGNSYADIGDTRVETGRTYWVVYLQPTPIGSSAWATYWWAGGPSIAASDQMQVVVRGYNASVLPAPTPSATAGPVQTPAPSDGPVPTQAPRPGGPTAPASATNAPVPAYAGAAHRVYHTCANGACGLRMRNGPGFSRYSAVGVKVDGDPVTIMCQTAGETVVGLDWSSSNVWDRLSDGTYASDYFIDTAGMNGAFSPGIPRCDASAIPAPLAPAPAAASAPYAVTSQIGVRRRSAPYIAAPSNGAIAFGTRVSVTCQAIGEAYGGSSVWDRTPDGVWIPDVFLDTPGRNGAFSAGIPRCADGGAPAATDGQTPSAQESAPNQNVGSGPTGTCRQDVVFIGVRGSGEPVGFGKVVYEAAGPTIAKFNDDAHKKGGVRLILDGLDVGYPALHVGFLLVPPLYFGSVRDGEARLLKSMQFHIRRFADNRCPGRLSFLLAGYSQGAWAVGDAYNNMSEEYRGYVKGVALFGDPRRQGSGFRGGVYDTAHHWPDGPSGKIWMSCRKGDPVCDTTRLETAAHILACKELRATCVTRFKEHLRYRGAGGDADRVGHWLASLVD